METKRIKRYVILNYLVFWIMVLGICGTASMVFHCPPVVMRILSNVCAWAPTIVLLVGFRYFCPEETVKDFYKRVLGGRISALTLVIAALITSSATPITVFVLSRIQGREFGSYWSLGAYPFWASFLFAITTGPTGEESGWRGYLRPYLNGKYSFFKASVIQGVIWAFWHTVLWFVDSDFMGIQMIPYIISNVVVMTGLCFIMNFFMEKNDNLIYGIVIHFCFNFLYCFLQADIWFYVILSAVYVMIIAMLCLARKMMGSSVFDRRFM